MNNKNIICKRDSGKKNKILLQMQKEVIKLENQIKYSKLINFKNGAIKNLRISARFGQRIAPYVLVAGIVTGGFKLLGAGLPFVSDEFTYYSHIMSEFDNKGNTSYEQQYERFSDDDNTLSLYTKWDLEHDGLYTRTVKTFESDKMTKEDILKLFDKLEEIGSLEDLLGPSISSKEEYINKLDIQEEENTDFLQGIIYDVDKEDFIIVKESTKENFFKTLGWVGAVLLAEGIPLIIRSSVSLFDFDECVEDIKRRYKKVDVENLTKKLKIKRDNYNRLLK